MEAFRRIALVLAWIAVVSGVTGCRPEPDEEPDRDDGTPTPPNSEAPEDVTPDRRGERPLVVDLKLENLSPLYKGFFSHEPFVQDLARELAPHILSRAVTVKVVWDRERSVGSIQLLVPDGEETLVQSGERLESERTLDTAPLMPYVRAIDGYRSAVGERYDLRVLSFDLALELWDPHSECRCLWVVVPGDEQDPQLGPDINCREPMGGTLELTRQGDSWPAPVKGTKKARKVMLGALGH